MGDGREGFQSTGDRRFPGRGKAHIGSGQLRSQIGRRRLAKIREAILRRRTLLGVGMLLQIVAQMRAGAFIIVTGFENQAEDVLRAGKLFPPIERDDFLDTRQRPIRIVQLIARHRVLNVRVHVEVLAVPVDHGLGSLARRIPILQGNLRVNQLEIGRQGFRIQLDGALECPARIFALSQFLTIDAQRQPAGGKRGRPVHHRAQPRFGRGKVFGGDFLERRGPWLREGAGQSRAAIGVDERTRQGGSQNDVGKLGAFDGAPRGKVDDGSGKAPGFRGENAAEDAASIHSSRKDLTEVVDLQLHHIHAGFR